MYSISETNFKNILRIISGWFLSKHPVNKNSISLKALIGEPLFTFFASLA